MKGITMNELYETVANARDVEFTYHHETYVLQTEIDDPGTFLVIWHYVPNHSQCIAKYPIPDQNIIPKTTIDRILNDKCFDGKSFMDIEKDVKVDVIY